MRIPRRLVVVFTLTLVCLAHADRARAQVFELISSFTGCTPEGCPTDEDPGVPWGPLILGPDGFFYGALVPDWREEVPRSRGAVYRIDTAGNRVILHRFDGEGLAGCLGGSLTVGPDGALYGIAHSCAFVSPSGQSIFRIVGTSLEVVHALPSGGGFSANTIFAGPAGAFYGLGRNTVERVVYEWNGAIREIGRYPVHDILAPEFVRGRDGNLYFPLVMQFPFWYSGYVLRIGPGGVLDVIHQTTATNEIPGNLVGGSDGHLYGSAGDPFRAPTRVLRLTLTGDATYIPGEGLRVLAAAADGSVFVTSGAAPHGNIQRLMADGTIIPIHTFDGTDGTGELTRLTQGPDGHFYGVRGAGGAHDLGVFYRIRMPAADIKANASDGPITIGAGNPLEISLAFDAAPTTTIDPSEVYVAVVTPTLQVYWMTAGGFSATPARLYAGPLAAFGSVPLLTFSDAGVLPPGDYYWVTIVDSDANGVPNGTFVDFVKTTRIGTR